MARLVSLLCIALVIGLAGDSAADDRRVLVWKDRLPGAAASDPDHLARLLGAAGIGAEVVDSAALADAARLDPGRVSLLVMPYGPFYPALARDALLTYLRKGGSLLSLGGRAFTEPVVPGPAGWVAAKELTRPIPGAPLMMADWGSPTATVGLASVPEGAMRWRRVRDGGGVLEVAAPNLEGYGYLALQGIAGRAGHPILRFRARGDRTTRTLCVEAQETDRSRWKVVLPLTEKWQTFRVHAAQFRGYATPSRSGPTDHFHPERVSQVQFGFTRTMVGGGPHRFLLDDVAWEPGLAVPEGVSLRPLALAEPSPEEPHFGKDLAPTAAGVLPLVAGVPMQGTLHASEHPLTLGARRVPARGWTAMAHADEPQKEAGGARASTAVPRRATGRSAPLLTARDSRGREIGPAVSLVVHSRGDFAGGRWVLSGVAGDLFPQGNTEAGASFVGLVRALVEQPLLGIVEPEFVVEDGKMGLRLAAEVVGAGQETPVVAEVDIRTRYPNLTKPVGADRLAGTVPAGKTVRLATRPLRADGLDPLSWEMNVSLLSGGRMVDHRAVTIDAAAAARALADELVRRQKPDGTYSGVAFIDHRGVRTLLAAWALTGDERYRRSALRWGETTMARQRPDGGYRMGYGITSVGESCFVADGGEIAIAIARLALDAPERDRPRYRRSLERYMAFREDFRCAEGGIGVGYCQTDYGVRPTVPLKEIRRIYAPEMNTYTVGCSLAAASAHAVLFGGASERERAIRDARWLMAHATSSLSGPVVEGFVWAHHLLPDAALRREIEAHLRERTLARLCGSGTAWWLGADGRSALGLDGLVYAAHTFPPDAATRAEMARALYAFCADASPWSVYRMRAEETWSQKEWIYLCYAGIGLVDALKPGITLPPEPRSVAPS